MSAPITGVRITARLAAPVLTIATLALLAGLASAPTPGADPAPVVREEIELASFDVDPGHTFRPVPWTTPIKSGFEITATFGETGLWASSHTGLDFNAEEGVPVQSVSAGKVTEVGYDGAYGNKVVVTRPDGTEIWYCHLSSTAVKVGQQLPVGGAIGAVGSTGNVTGSHLHLEIRPAGGEPVDPQAYLAERGVL